ncbi:unnamed protein product [Lampetra fluviatilis]
MAAALRRRFHAATISKSSTIHRGLSSVSAAWVSAPPTSTARLRAVREELSLHKKACTVMIIIIVLIIIIRARQCSAENEYDESFCVSVSLTPARAARTTHRTRVAFGRPFRTLGDAT